LGYLSSLHLRHLLLHLSGIRLVMLSRVRVNMPLVVHLVGSGRGGMSGVCMVGRSRCRDHGHVRRDSLDLLGVLDGVLLGMLEGLAVMAVVLGSSGLLSLLLGLLLGLLLLGLLVRVGECWDGAGDGTGEVGMVKSIGCG